MCIYQFRSLLFRTLVDPLDNMFSMWNPDVDGGGSCCCCCCVSTGVDHVDAVYVYMCICVCVCVCVSYIPYAQLPHWSSCCRHVVFAVLVFDLYTIPPFHDC